MRKFSILLLALVCVVGLCVVPAFAEDTGGGELPPDLEQDEWNDGPSGTYPASGIAPVPTEKEGTKWDMEEIRAYVNGTVIPTAVMVLTSLGSLYIALLPILNKWKAANTKFEGASGELKETAADSRAARQEAEAAIKSLKEDYQGLRQEYHALQDKYIAMAERVEGALSLMQGNVTATMQAVDGRNEQIEKMLIVAFCNNKELVDKGFARKIAQIGAGVAVDMDEIADVEQEGEYEQDGIEEAS